jgi:hypothetical protein
LLQAGEAEIKTLAEVEYFACGGVGFGNVISDGEKSFKKIYSEKNNLEQFVVIYGRGTTAARMYALIAFYHLNRPLYEHLKAQYQEGEAKVTMIMGCDRFSQTIEQVISTLEKNGYASLIPTGSTETR